MFNTPRNVDDRWIREDKFHESFLVNTSDDALEHCVKTSNDNQLRPIAVTAMQGKFLHLQAKIIGAKRILELGTLGGYSTIWLARALPEGGELVTCEYSPKHAEVAKKNIEHAGLSSKVKILVGPAAESLAKMDPSQKFDFVFMDADKAGYPVYLEFCKTLVRKGGVIIIDNIVRDGGVSDLSITDNNDLNGVRKTLESLRNSTEFDATTLQTVSDKGWDGFTFVWRL
ncbi:S-adenosyl-L-methionine-dependent methyltransferase [Neolentinus lepideus HHB14362 ss-1]|uniref:S-adenosyl-L-methionine-dependent methyltransferase n=1 Tax=Neolentinus lepideus HHB14362 ss-1 TaxID=1314782 RepID=A0A165TWT8_9AGAM|nr:S-adenosyl-L-methionine-dependent methyltransferase [Neolentinus lepideus HHB14362 ss-1]